MTINLKKYGYSGGDKFYVDKDKWREILSQIIREMGKPSGYRYLDEGDTIHCTYKGVKIYPLENKNV